MLPNFGYGCQIMPTDVKKQGLPQMSANRPNIGSTRNIVMFWPWNTRGVPVNAPQIHWRKSSNAVQYDLQVQDRNQRTQQHENIKLATESQEQSKTMSPHDPMGQAQWDLAKVSIIIYPLLLLIDVPAPKMSLLKNISQKPMFFLALTHLHMLVNILKDNICIIAIQIYCSAIKSNV